MALRFLLDENQRGLLWRAIQRHNQTSPDQIDALRVGDVTELPLGSLDDAVLAWCEREDRILVTFDKKSLAAFLQARQQAGGHSPGILMLTRGSHLPSVVEYLAMVAYASEAFEWRDRIAFIPTQF